MSTPQEIASRADELLRPISDGAPAGQNPAYEPQFEALKAEVTKLDSPTGGEVDWERVGTEGRQILQSLSKDLVVASYTTYALLQTERLSGFAVGLGVLNGIFDKYWDDCFPPRKRMRGRTNALDWLLTRVETALPQLSVQPSDRAALDLVLSSYKELSASARDKMEDAAPGMGAVREALTRIDMKIPKAAPTPGAAAPAPAEAAPPQPAPADNPPAPAPAPAAADNPPAPAGDAPPADASPPPADADAPAPAANDQPAPPPEPAAAPDDPLAPILAEAAKWLEPIAANNPTGDDARYEPEYEQARTEVGKLESATGEEVDWESVAEAADMILRSKAKDLLMASYLAYAKYDANGIEGLTVGLAVLTGILDKYPQGRWPKRTRGQGNAVAWLTGHLDNRLGQFKPQPKDRDAVEALGKVLKKMGASLRERLEDHAPGTRPLEERVQRMLLSIPKPQPKAEAKPEPKPQPQAAPAAPRPQPAAAPKAAPAMPGAQADVGSAEEVGKYLLETGRAMVKAANLLRRAQLSSASAYRLLRTGLYLHLDKAPPSGAGGKTQIPPLPPQRRKPLELMEANEKWEALLEETEAALGTFRFFMDLHFLSAKALKALGPEFAPAHAALCGEVGALLRRMPQLLDLAAADGSPLASDETKQWIAAEVASGGGGGGGGTSTDDPGDELKKVKTLLTTQKGAEAMKIARNAIEEAGHPRLKFVRRLALAEACLGADQAQLARAMFSALDEELRVGGLVEWESELAGRCLEGLVRAIRATIKKGAKPDGSSAEAFARLAAVDPVRAAKLATG